MHSNKFTIPLLVVFFTIAIGLFFSEESSSESSGSVMFNPTLYETEDNTGYHIKNDAKSNLITPLSSLKLTGTDLQTTHYNGFECVSSIGTLSFELGFRVSLYPDSSVDNDYNFWHGNRKLSEDNASEIDGVKVGNIGTGALFWAISDTTDFSASTKYTNCNIHEKQQFSLTT